MTHQPHSSTVPIRERILKSIRAAGPLALVLSGVVTVLAIVALGMTIASWSALRPAATASSSAEAAPTPTASGQATAEPIAEPSPSSSGAVATNDPTRDSSPSPLTSSTPAPTTGGDGDGQGAAGPSAIPTNALSVWTGITFVGEEEFGVRFPAHAGPSQGITDVAFWRSSFIAVGYDASEAGQPRAIFLTSSDGAHWQLTESLPSGAIAPLRIILLDHSVLAASMAGGEGAGLWRSSDGHAWTPIESQSWNDAWSGGQPYDVAGRGSGVVAIGGESSEVGDAVVLRSPDGLVWERVTPMDVFGAASLNDVASFAEGFVIGGSVREDVSLAAAWVSPDGRSWSRALVERAGENTPAGFTELLVGSDGLAALSTSEAGRASWASRDGSSWSRTTASGWLDDIEPWGRAILASDGMRMVSLGCCVLGGGAYGWVSTDGLHWDELVIPGTPDGLMMVDVAKRIAIGPDRAAFWVTGELWPTGGRYQVFWPARAEGS